MSEATTVDPLRLLTADEAATLLGVAPAQVTALMDRNEIAEFFLPNQDLTPGKRRRRYTSRLAIEAWQRSVLAQAGPVARAAEHTDDAERTARKARLRPVGSR